MTPQHLTLYRGATDQYPIDHADFRDWPEMCEALRDALAEESAPRKEGLLALGPYRLSPGATRSDASVEAITVLALDVDRGSIQAALERLSQPDLADVAAAIYTSPSDAGGEGGYDRFRVLMAVDREIAPRDCERSRFALAELLGLEPGSGPERAFEPSKLFFLGRLEGTPEREWWHRDGVGISVDELLARPLAHVWRKNKRKSKPRAKPDASASAPEDALDRARELARSLPPSIEGQGGDQALFVAASELGKVLGEDTHAVLEVLSEEFNPRCEPPWDSAKLTYEAERATSRQAAPEQRWARRMRAQAAEKPSTPGQCFAPVDADDLVLDVKKSGEPRATHANAVRVLSHVFGDRLYYDELRGKVTLGEIDASVGHFPAGAWTDAHTTSFIMLCEDMQLAIGATVAHAAVVKYARERTRNLLREELERMAASWDGTPRVDQALHRYWGALDSALSRAVSRVFMLSLAARGLEPGCKMDTCPLLIGAQGIKKSTSLRALIGDAWFSDSHLTIGDKEGLQGIRGWWLRELPEHVAISKKDAATVKAFLSSECDTYRASYDRFAESVPRLTCFVSTSNEYEVLNDPTGARRFLPVCVGVDGDIDVDSIARDREQLLGEAAARVLRGEKYWPSEDEGHALRPAQDAASAGELDPWEDAVSAWLHAQGDRTDVTTSELFDELTGPVPTPLRQIGKREHARISLCMRRLGFERAMVARSGSGRRRGWARQ